MNEQIRKFSLQAGATLNKGYIELSDGQLMLSDEADVDHTNMDLEKFAESIIRECMNCTDWVGKVNQNPVEPVHTAHAIKQRIEQQLGVRK